MSAARLQELLGAEPPGSIGALDEATVLDLAVLIEQARQRQSRGLVEAFEATFRHVPRPMRALVRKVLVG